MNKINLIIILLISNCIGVAVATQYRLKRDADSEDNLLAAVSEIQQVVLRLSATLETKVDEIKTELRKEMQDVKSELRKETNELQGGLTEIRKQIQELQTKSVEIEMINSLSLKVDKSRLELELLHTNLDSCNSMIRSAGKTGTLILEQVNNSRLSKTEEKQESKLDKMDTKIEQLNTTLDSVTIMGQQIYDTIIRGQEWIVIQKRGVPLKAGRTREIFSNRTWTEYKNGFGSYDADLWFGLDKIHDLVEDGFTELRIEMEDWEGNRAFAQYSHFHIQGESDNYRLNMSGYTGNAGDSMAVGNNGQQFSTMDKDNDKALGHCAQQYGPWWHNNCGSAFLNYDYQKGSKVETWNGIIWWTWKSSSEYSLKKVEMKIRRPRTKL